MKRHILTKKAAGRKRRLRHVRAGVGRGRAQRPEDAAGLADERQRTMNGRRLSRTPDELTKGSRRAARATVAAWKRDGAGLRSACEGTATMPRVKRGSKRREKRKKILSPGQGLLPHQEQALPLGQGGDRPRGQLRLRGPQAQEARLPPALDHPHQRRRARPRHLLQPVHRGPEAGGRRPRPQVAGRHRGARRGGLRGPRGLGQGGGAGGARAASAKPSRPRAHPPDASAPGGGHRSDPTIPPPGHMPHERRVRRAERQGPRAARGVRPRAPGGARTRPPCRRCATASSDARRARSPS